MLHPGFGHSHAVLHIQKDGILDFFIHIFIHIVFIMGANENVCLVYKIQSTMKKKELIEDDDFKKEFSEVKNRIADQHTKLAKMRLETFNIDEAVDYVFGFVGTLPETWVEADFTQKQQLQSLIFPEKPVYTYSGFETPVLSPIFATKKTHHIDESLLVISRRIELRLPGCQA